MLVFSETNKYEVNDETIVSREETVLNERTLKTPKKKNSKRKKKLTKTNEQFLTSLGFKLKQTQ